MLFLTILYLDCIKTLLVLVYLLGFINLYKLEFTYEIRHIGKFMVRNIFIIQNVSGWGE